MPRQVVSGQTLKTSLFCAAPTYTHCGVTQTWQLLVEEAITTLQCPGFVRRVKKILPIIGDSFAIVVHDNGGAIVFGRCWPVLGDIDLLGIPESNRAIVLESRCPRPQRADARARMLKERRDFLKRFEIVPCFSGQRIASLKSNDRSLQRKSVSDQGERRTSERQLRQHKQIEVFQVFVLGPIQHGIRSIKVVIDVADERSELQTGHFHLATSS